jgi:hypothetical protein
LSGLRLRLDPGRAKTGSTHLATERPFRRHRRSSSRANVGYGV